MFILFLVNGHIMMLDMVMKIKFFVNGTLSRYAIHGFFLFKLEHPGNSSSPARCCIRLRWTSSYQSILMVCLSQGFLNSRGKFQIGISRFKTLSSLRLVFVKSILPTMAHSSYFILTVC